MTKQLIALALAAAFGIAHAADVKPAAAPVAATAKTEAAKPEVQAPETKPAVAAPEVKKDAVPAVEKKVKKEKKVTEKVEPKAAPEAAKAVEPAKK